MVKINTILITGGHITPALAVVEKLKQNSTYKVCYVGRKTATEGDSAVSLEYTTCQRLKIPFYPITTARFQRSFGFRFFLSMLKFPIGFVQSLLLVKKVKPSMVITFGGYIALPVALAAIINKIPFLIHEQTSVMGLTNRILSKYARWVCISWKHTKLIPPHIQPHLIYTGNVVRTDILMRKKTSILEFGSSHIPLLYITGGSQGSVSINRLIAPIVPQLVQKYRVLHQCGSSNHEQDYKYLLSIKNSLPFSYKRNYQVEKHIDQKYVGTIYAEAFMVVSRSGANTITELTVLGVPAILIPLPWSGGNEQYENARILEEAGSAIIADQHKLDAVELMKKIDSMAFHHASFKERAISAKELVPLNAASTIVSIIDTYLSKTTAPQNHEK